MLNKTQKLITLVTNSISLVLAILVLVPLGKNTVSNGELVFKLIVCPIIACLIFLCNSYIKYVIGSNEYKYTSFSAYMGVFAFIVAMFAYTVEILLRTGAGEVYSTQSFVVLVAIFTLLAAVFAAIGIFMQKFVIFLKSKESIFLDIVIILFVIALAIVEKAILGKHVDVPMDSSVLQYIVVPLLFGLAVATILVFVMLNYYKYNDKFVCCSRKELLEKWNAGREEVYHQAELDILYNLYNFSKNELGIEEEIIEEVEEETPAEETPVEEPQPEEAPQEEVPVEEAPAEEVEEEAQPEVDPAELAAAEARIAELQQQKDELNKVEEAEEEQPKEAKVYPPKTFKPTFAELVKLAQGLEGVTYEANAEGTNYKFMVGKKVFLMLQDGPKSYKMTFLMDFPEAAKFSQYTSFNKSKTPKGEYSFKLTNKGDFEPAEIKGIVKNAYKMLDTIQERLDAKKAEEKARKAEEKLQAKLAEMEPAEREKYLKRLEESKKTPEQKAKEAEEAKAKKEAEKAAAKAKADAQKQKEKEKLAAQKQKEKEKIAAQKQKEKEKAKAAAQKQKEKEKAAAKAKAEKEKAAAKAKAEKEKAAAKKAEQPKEEAKAEEAKAE